MSPTPTDIARVCHEANRAWQAVTNDPNPSVEWSRTDEATQRSAVEGVEKALAGATPEQLHESWCESKLADGWRVGAVKDAVAKTHPCLVAYDDLPPEQRTKDALFLAVVTALRGTDA